MWLCKLVGHKFVKKAGGYVYRPSTPQSFVCYRCGVRPYYDNEAQGYTDKSKLYGGSD